MIIDLDKEALISLVRGDSPNHSLFDNNLISYLGSYDDCLGWVWFDNELKKLTEGELYSIYLLCRNSWIK